MGIEDELKKLECIKKVLLENKPFALAVATIHADRSERIFTNGENSSGGSIGRYDTDTPMYVNPNKVPRATRGSFGAGQGNFQGLKPPAGKHGDTKFKSGKPHKTTYVNSYADLRNRMGKRIDIVNLTLFGNLKSNFENRSRGVPSATKINNNEYIVGLDAENSEKKQGLEKKYGEIFPHTQTELTKFPVILGQELQNTIKTCG